MCEGSGRDNHTSPRAIGDGEPFMDQRNSSAFETQHLAEHFDGKVMNILPKIDTNVLPRQFDGPDFASSISNWQDCPSTYKQMEISLQGMFASQIDKQRPMI
mmetsp:Transcript_7186/g.13740  ORF Transcript_7186/g.13740 Transcript_7186/m.13740 type:complete len:102 (-) Transcript_7186:381-686(-)|eukprot:scaffold1294_cov167-Amphora_coffeaeformis.AAC.5